MKRVLALVVLALAVPVVMLWRGPGALGPPADRAVPADLSGADPLVIVVLGTSLSSERYDWPEALAEALETCLTQGVTVARVTRPGANVTWGAGQGAAVAAFSPDLVLVEFAINDADLRDGVGRGAARVETEALLAGLEVPAVLMTMNPASGLRGVLRPFLGRHYADYRDMDVPLIDLEARWRELPRGARGLADGLHPDLHVARDVIIPPVRDYIAGLAGVAEGCEGSG